MKKVILLGDSIRQIGYGKRVPELLGSEYSVWQPNDNCRFAQYTLRGMWDWREQLKDTDVVHWNNGLWDVCDLFGDGAFTPLDVYTDTILRIAEILKRNAKKVIFATTTPVSNLNPHNKNGQIIEYNKHIVGKLTEQGVLIDDLHAVVYPHIDDYIREDLIHLSEAGIEVCANAVAGSIRAAASEL